MSDGPVVKSKRGERRPRAWWQWVVGLALLGGAALSIVARLVPALQTAGRIQPVDPVPFRLSPGMGTSDTVPASPGSLADCNVLLVTLDTTRSDRLGCYGNEGIETPTLDRLARAGVLFSQAYAPASTTLPSHAAILTGRYPYHHGARNNGLFRLSERAETLGELLSARGYATAAVVSSIVLDSRFGLARGFDRYYDDIDATRKPTRFSLAERPANETNEVAIRWLREQGRNRFFLWVHYYDPHSPYSPPGRYAERYTGAGAYDGEIAFVDAQLDELLGVVEEVGAADNTLIVVAGDHGEGLGQHGEWTHGLLIYDSTLQVPLIMHCPGRLKGGVHVSRLVNLVDLFPTVLAMIGVEHEVETDGIDLTRAPSGRRTMYYETLESLWDYGWAPLLAVREGRMKYIYGPETELYDLGADPHESKNLVASRPEVAREMERKLAAFFGDDLEKAVAAEPTVTLPPEELRKLQSLGYLRGNVGATVPAGPLRHPRDMLELKGRIEEITARGADVGAEEMIEELRALVDEHPDFGHAYKLLGSLYVETGDLEGAESSLRRCLELEPNSPTALFQLARLNGQRQDMEAASALYRRGLALCPDHLGGLQELGKVLAAQQRYDEAADVFLRAFELAPDSVSITESMTSAMLASDRGDEAIAALRAVLTKRPELSAARNSLALLLASREEYSEALALLRENYELHPDKHEMGNNLAALLISCSDKELANPVQASLIMERICAETGYRQPNYMYTLSRAYAGMGRFGEAIALAQRARQVAVNSGQMSLAELVSARLKQFEAIKGNVIGVPPITGLVPPLSEQKEQAEGGEESAPDG